MLHGGEPASIAKAAAYGGLEWSDPAGWSRAIRRVGAGAIRRPTQWLTQARPAREAATMVEAVRLGRDKNEPACGTEPADARQRVHSQVERPGRVVRTCCGSGERCSEASFPLLLSAQAFRNALSLNAVS